MKKMNLLERVALLGLLTIAFLAGMIGTPTQALAQGLPDVVPMLESVNPPLPGVDDWIVSRRTIGGILTNRLEFSILTVNIGGQDFWRPRNPEFPTLWLIPQIYEFGLYLLDEKTYEWLEIDRRRKNTICTIDDSRRGRQADLACLRTRTTPFFGCGATQGVSVGWGDDYFRGLAGQWVVIGDFTGWFLLEAHLDPDYDLLREDIADRSKDATHDNNYAYTLFYWDGSDLYLVENYYGYDRTTFCPAS